MDVSKIDLNLEYREKAAHFLGYGQWEAPYWFIGQEEGEPPREDPEWELRVRAWLSLGRPEICDCRDFHQLINQSDLFAAKPRRVVTWASLIRALLAFHGRRTSLDDIYAYQRDFWGRANGETCLIELSGVPAKNLTAGRDLGTTWFSPEELNGMRERRVSLICERITEGSPRFVLMYGLRDQAHWQTLAGQSLIPGQSVRIGKTTFVMSRAPAAYGSTNEYWVNLGMQLRNQNK